MREASSETRPKNYGIHEWNGLLVYRLGNLKARSVSRTYSYFLFTRTLRNLYIEIEYN